MREILFRGKRTDNGEWVEGFLHTKYFQELPHDRYVIEYEPKSNKYKWQPKYLTEEIDPETVGEYTGLTDKNGKKIFEGDIVKCKDNLEPKKLEFQGYIDFKNGSFVIVGDFMTHYRWIDYECEVIGNIHDNPELLKERVDNA